MPHILLVDDDNMQALTRKVILQKVGFDVEVASSPMAALGFLDSFGHGRGFKLIITDHLMPEMNGPELVQEVRKAGRFIPVLVLSGLPSAEPDYDGLNVVFRVKPFAPDHLVALVRDLVGEEVRRTA